MSTPPSLSRPLSRRFLLVLGARGVVGLGLGLALPSLALGTLSGCHANSSEGGGAGAAGDPGGEADGGSAAGSGASAAGALAEDVLRLGPPDANGLRLLPGFRARVVARSGERVGATDFVWHTDPDGGATFATPDGGWVYVSNAETEVPGTGSVGVLRFDAKGGIVDAYRILSGTNHNCAGGRTPWGTWLSCEEVPMGRVFECDPLAPGSEGELRAALGLFQHEAIAVDPITRRLYMTEDRSDGLLYRFTPDAWPSLASGTLEAAEVLDPEGDGPIRPGQVRMLAWHPVPDPLARERETRFQVEAATRFNGGEGIDHHEGRVYFSTKGDDRVWRLDVQHDRLEIVYDRASRPDGPLSGVDNVVVATNGVVYVAEDPGDQQLVALLPSGATIPILQVMDQPFSEITGPALSPDGSRLYFSSQRPGTTYEIAGPFGSLGGTR
ncbi:MAG: DUF839 domain-containing protein [Myxococcota bacterium]